MFIGFNVTFFTQFMLGSARHAAALLQLPAAVPAATRDLDFRIWILGAGLFLTAAYLLATFRKPMDAPHESLGRTDARVGSAFAADHAQLRFRPGPDAWTVRLPTREAKAR